MNFPPPNTTSFASNDDAAAAIVDSALAATQPAPPPKRGLLSRLDRRHPDAVPQSTPAPTRAARAPRVRTRSQRTSSTPVRMLLAGLLAVVLLGSAAVATGAIQLDSPDGSPLSRPGGRDMDGSWSYYHDRDFNSDEAGAAKWSTDRTRSTDPDEAVLGNTTRWEYDGPYRYGAYGSDGMRRRSAGRESRDPIYSQPAPIQDVFSAYGGDLDPSGGAPVGVAPSSMTNPYYDPYAGYSNPYANRIRMAYGEGYGRGAAFDPQP
jgi:hypothetical protein